MKQTLKRLLSLAVALFLVISMIPATALPALAAEETSAPAQQAETEASTQSIVYPEGWSVEYHCVCGNPGSTDNPCAKEGHKMVQWQPWTVQGVAPFRAGYWYLTEDITSVNANQFPYGTDFKTNTAVIGRDQVNGATVLLGKQVSVYVDLNGKTVTGNTNHRIFRLENDFAHNLTITDTVGTGKLVPKGGGGNAGMGIWTRNAKSVVTIYGGTIDGSAAALTSGSGSVISNCATVEIYGGKIIGGTVTIASGNAVGGSIYNTGTLNIYGGTIEGGTATASAGDAFGGVIYSSNKLNIYGGTIKGGTVNSPVGDSNKYARGGTIGNDSTMEIRGGTIEGGTANGHHAQGGAIFNNNGDTLNIYGGTITGGTANATTGAAQGGVVRNQGKLNIYGGTISGGTATTTGGTTQGCTVSNVSTFYMENGTIEGGTAKATTGAGVGAALFSTTGGTMKGGTIIGGYCYKGNATASGACGGAIYIYGGTFTMDGGTVKAKSYTTNVAYQGGAVFVRNGGTFVLNKGVVAAGKVNDYGGAIATQGGGTITINGGVVTGTFYADGTPVTDPADANATGVVKVNNSAGAAVGAWGGTINMTGGTIIGGLAGNVGGGVAVRSGAVFNMSGGLITGGKGTSGSYKGGGNVAVDYQNSSRPSFIMTGGTITGGTGVYPGVMVNRGGQISISGNAVITGNRDDNGNEINLALLDDNGSGASYGLKLNIGEMGSKASVGISMATPGVFSNAVSEANAAAFFGDSGCYIEQLEDGTLQLVKGHQAHCVCGGSDTHSGCDHTALEGEWKPWDGKSVITEGGNYYLTQSVVGDYQRWMGGVYGNTTVMTINLCLNGHSIDNTKNANRALGIAANVTVNLMNCSHCESVLTGGCKGNSGTAAFLYNSTSKLNMYDNVKIVAAPGVEGNISGAVHVPTGATFNMYGGELVGGYVKSTGGAVNVSANATFNLYDGKISGGNAAGGGNINLEKGAKFTMYGGEIVGGISRQTHGGNLYVHEDAVATILGGTIRDGVVTIPEGATGDAADKNGGNIAMVDQDNDDLGSLTIGGTAVIKNGQANRGGNIFIHTGSLTIKDSAKIEGGVAYGLYKSTGSDYSVEVNWGRSESNANNRTYVAISGNPQINHIYYNDWFDTTGLEAGAKIVLNRAVTGKVSSGVLSDELAACFSTDNNTIRLVNEADALYVHKPTYVAATEASCHQDGHAEYWYCERCDVVYADAAMTQITNIKNLTIEAAPLTYVAAVEPGCHQNGCAEYWYCAECDAVFADAAGAQLTNRKNLTIPATVGLTHVEAQEATCHQNGMAEYWYCAECEAVFADAAGTILTNRKNLTIEAAPLTYVAAQEASCHQAGHAEYWYCMECEAIFTDAAGIHLTNIKNLSTPALVGLTHVDAREATCHQTGHAEYWYCMECEAVFADAAGTMLTNIKNLSTPALVGLTYVPAQEASCHQNGHAEYWYCAECEAVFADAAGMMLTNIKNLTIEAAPLTYVPAVEVGCHQNGCAEYWYCETCDAVFADAAGIQLTNRKNLVIAAAPLTYVAAVEAACHQNGCAEYWYCETCDAVFADAAATQLTNRKNLTIPATVGLTYVAAVEVGCHQNGMNEYWYCAECDAVFADAAATQLTNRKNLVIAAAPLTYVEAVEVGCHQNGCAEYWYCETCEAVFADAAGTILTNRKNLVIAAAPLTYVAAVEAACHQNGCAEYWYCETCEAVFADAAATQLTNRKNLTIPATVGLTYVAAVEVGCHQNGMNEYWYCAECDAVFADAAATQLTNRKNLVIAAAPLTYVAAEAADFGVNGHYEYWYCETCDAVFADAAATQLTNRKNLTIPALVAVAQIGEQKFESLAAAIAAAGTEAAEIDLVANITLDAGLLIAKGQNITLDLNGYTVSYTSDVPADDMITNRGNLTITDSAEGGKLTYVNTDTTAYNVTVSTISTEPGSTLTVNGGIIENKTVYTNGIYAYAIDALTNANLGDVTVTINDGTVYSDYHAIRQYNNSTVCLNTLIINGGYIYGGGRGIQSHVKNNAAVTTINGGKMEAGGYVLCLFATEAPISITGGEFIGTIYSATANIISGGTYTDPSLAEYAAYYCAEGFTVVDNGDGTYGIKEETVLNPEDQEAYQGEYVTFTAEGIGEGLTYQWQYSTNGGEAWFNSSSATQGYNTNTLTVKAERIRDGFLYRCRITDADGNKTYTEPALLNVLPDDTAILVNPADVLAQEGTAAKFTVVAEGEGLTYRWQYSQNGSYWLNSTSATQGYNTNELTVQAALKRNGFQYRCIVTDAQGVSYISEVATLTVEAAGVTSPADQTAAVGTVVTFTVSVEAEVVSYKWQYSTNGGEAWFASSFEGCNTASMDVVATAGRDGFMYRCVIITADGGEIVTNPATLDVQ